MTAVIDRDEIFWRWARQVATFTADPHRSYNELKRDWQDSHPEASHTEHEAMTARLSKLLRI